MTGYVRLELRRFTRMPAFLVFTMIMPMIMYLMFTNLRGITGQDRQAAALWTMVNLAAYGAIGALLNYGSSVVNDRSIGWLRQLRLSPLSPVRVVVAKGMAGMALAIGPIVLMCVAGAVVNGVRLSTGRWLEVLPLLWLGAAPFVLLGLGIGFVASLQTTQAATMLSYLALSIVGGLWFPLEAMPHALELIGRYTPTNAYADLVRQVAFGGSPPLADLVTLTVWVVLFAAFAVYAYRRSVRRVD